MQIIARSQTLSYGVAIVKHANSFEVIQIAEGGVYITWDRAVTEADARKSANRLWTRGMGREVMIGYGGPAV